MGESIHGSGELHITPRTSFNCPIIPYTNSNTNRANGDIMMDADTSISLTPSLNAQSEYECRCHHPHDITISTVVFTVVVRFA